MKSRTSRVVSNNNKLTLERLLVSTYYHLLQLRIVYLQALNHILLNIISESIAIKSFDFSTVGWTPAFSLSYRQGLWAAKPDRSTIVDKLISEVDS